MTEIAEQGKNYLNLLVPLLQISYHIRKNSLHNGYSPGAAFLSQFNKFPVNICYASREVILAGGEESSGLLAGSGEGSIK